MRKPEGDTKGNWELDLRHMNIWLSPSQFPWALLKPDGLKWVEIFVFCSNCLGKSPRLCSLFADISCSSMDLGPPLSSAQPVRTTPWRPTPCTRRLPGRFPAAPSPDPPLPSTNLTGAATGSARPWAPPPSPWPWPCYSPMWLVSPFPHASLFFFIKVLFGLWGVGSLSALTNLNQGLELKMTDGFLISFFVLFFFFTLSNLKYL